MNFENLSEEDLYSDEEDINNYGDGMQDGGKGIGGLPAAAERRAHHNALERKRRDHIKDSFTSLRESVPTLKGDKVKASRAQILKKAADYIGNLKSKNESCESDIEEILKQNKTLLETVRMIETRAQANGIPLPPTIKGELSSVSSSTSAIAGPVSQSLDNHSTTKKKTLCVTTTAMPQKSTGGTISALKRPATSIMSSTTSVISGGSGTVKLESHGKTITNPNKIFLVNSNYRTAGTADGRQVVIPTGGSRLITTNTIKNGVGTSTTTGQPIKIIIQSNAPQNVIKREH